MKTIMKNKLFGTLFSILLVVTFCNAVLADERIGGLVFSAMKEIQDTHKDFLGNVEKIKNSREEALAERESVKKQYTDAKNGSVDKREFHARFSLAQAKVYRALYDEAKLTHQVAGKQLTILNRLNDSISSTGTGMDQRDTMQIIEATKPFLDNGKNLLKSLGGYRHKITDPVINSKLNAAYQTAQMLSKYVEHLEKGNTNKYASQLVLKQRVVELVEQLNALYVQTDIFMGILRDKTTVLKMINQLAASEAAIWAVSEGGKDISQLSGNVMASLMDVMNESDMDLNTLISGVLEDNGKAFEASTNNYDWANPKF